MEKSKSMSDIGDDVLRSVARGLAAPNTKLNCLALAQMLSSSKEVNRYRSLFVGNSFKASWALLKDLQEKNVSLSRVCDALKQLGNYEAVFPLLPSEPPTIVREPDGAIGKSGSRLTLTVKAKGNPRPSFSWYRSKSDGEEPEEVKSGRYVLLEKKGSDDGSGEITVGQLVLTDLHVADVGLYCCCVETEYFQPQHTPYVIVQMEPDECGPRILRSSYLEKFCYIGETVALECEALAKPDDLEYAWYRNGVLLKDKSNRRSLITANLPGEYQCEVKNGVGSVKNDVIKVFMVCQKVPVHLNNDDAAVSRYFNSESKRHLVIKAPEAVLSLGPSVMESYFNEVLGRGLVKTRRIPIFVVGQDRSGKTALTRALVEGLPKTKPTQVSHSTSGIETSRVACRLDDPKHEFERIGGKELTRVIESEMGRIRECGDGKGDEDARYLFLSFCDFAGQPIYFNSNSCFMSNRGVYLIVHNLDESLDDVAVVRFADAGGEREIDDEGCGTNGEYIKTWIGNVALTTEIDDPRKPIALAVGTHFDVIVESYSGVEKRVAFLSQKKKRIDDMASDVIDSRHFSPIEHFFVDNIGNYHYANDEFKNLRARIVQTAKSDEYEINVPVVWLSFEARLDDVPDDSLGFMLYDDIERLAFESGLPDEGAIRSMLKFYHAINLILWFSDVPQLADIVITKPERLLALFRSVITLKISDAEPDYWEELRQTGTIEYRFIEQMLDAALAETHNDGRNDLKDKLFNLLQKFDLVAPYVLSDDELDGQTFDSFIIPSMIVWDPRLTGFADLNASSGLAVVELLSSHHLVPDALFNRLVVRTIRAYPVGSEVYRYFARFHVDSKHDLLLLNCAETGLRDRIKVVIQHQNDDNRTLKIVCGRTLRFVITALAEVRGFGMNGLRFQLEVISPQRKKLTKKCDRHKRPGCAEPTCFPSLIKDTKDNVWFAEWPQQQQDSRSQLSFVSGTRSPASCRKVEIAVAKAKLSRTPHHQLHFVVVGSEAKLSCIKSSHKINWFNKGKKLQTSKNELVIQRFVSRCDGGFYTCLSLSDGRRTYAKPVYLKGITESGPLLQRDPKIELARGKGKSRGSDQIQVEESLKLKLVYEAATAETNLQFQWHQNGLVLPGAVEAVLSIDSAADHHTGTYRCHVSHVHTPREDRVAAAAAADDDDHHDDLVFRSHPFRIEINVPSLSSSTLRGIQNEAHAFNEKPRDGVISKVALLIGNRRYKYERFAKIKLTENDICEVADLLETLDFTVLAYADLTFCEMAQVLQEFYTMIRKGAYALFYFAGHGLECNGDVYMLPVDVRNLNVHSAFREKAVEYHMKMKSPRLSVMLLDCCRTTYLGEQTKVFRCQLPGISSGTGFKQYSCYYQSSAFEPRAAALSHSVYAEVLVEKLKKLSKTDGKEPDSVRVMLDSISMGVIEGRKKHFKETMAWQTPQTTWHGPENALSLADGIRSDEEKAERKRRASKLEPERQVLLETNGFKIVLQHELWLKNAVLVGAVLVGASCEAENSDAPVTFSPPKKADESIVYEVVSSLGDAEFKAIVERFPHLQHCHAFVKVYNHHAYNRPSYEGDPTVPVNVKVQYGGTAEEYKHSLPPNHLSETSWSKYAH